MKHFGPNKENTVVHLPKPTWGNHNQIIKYAGLQANVYKQYNSKTIKASVDWVLEDLEKANANDVVLLHACAHNPTGCDLTLDEWKQVSSLIAKKRLVPLVDSAYQGFSSGCLDKDGAVIKLFADEGHPVICVQS